MKRSFVLFVFTCVAAAAIASCGGGANYDYTVVPDKLTVVGSGS